MFLTADIRNEIDISLNIWKDLLTEFFTNQIETIYAKGSAIKFWSNSYDYVPILSDVDIHVYFKPEFDNVLNEISLNESILISKMYESIYKDKVNFRTHLPRIQLTSVNDLKKILRMC